MDDDASSANSVKNFWHHLKKLGIMKILMKLSESCISVMPL